MNTKRERNKQNLDITKRVFRRGLGPEGRMDAFYSAQGLGFDASWHCFKRMWGQLLAETAK